MSTIVVPKVISYSWYQSLGSILFVVDPDPDPGSGSTLEKMDPDPKPGH